MGRRMGRWSITYRRSQYITVPSISPLAIRPPLVGLAAAHTNSCRCPFRDMTRDSDRESYNCGNVLACPAAKVGELDFTWTFFAVRATNREDKSWPVIPSSKATTLLASASAQR